MRDSSGARVLVVDDEKLIRWSMTQALEQAGYVVEQAETAAQALAACERETPDLILLDYKLPDRLGTEILPELRRSAPEAPVIMITAHASVPGAVEAVREGASDYVSKPFQIGDLLQTVKRVMESSHLRQVVAWQHGQALRGNGLGGIVASSAAMSQVAMLVERVARSGAATVLLTGESGVGKGLIARLLHKQSQTASEAFMHIACTSLPEQLLESELFGHEKGAFTDARVQKKGLIELADKGTVFLDEIGDITPGLQSKLLGFLEERTFRRVGGVRDMQVSVRVIAATNKDLEREVEQGRFRRDLYYRLKVIPVPIPPLRERREDLEELAGVFVRHFNAEFGKSVLDIDARALEAMLEYPWPGNVRELRNAIERAVLLGDGHQLQRVDLPPEIGRGHTSEAGAVGMELPAEGVVLEDLEREFVCQALRRTHGNRARAARLLGLNRDQMRYRIKKFELVEFEDDGGAE